MSFPFGNEAEAPAQSFVIRTYLHTERSFISIDSDLFFDSG